MRRHDITVSSSLAAPEVSRIVCKTYVWLPDVQILFGEGLDEGSADVILCGFVFGDRSHSDTYVI